MPEARTVVVKSPYRRRATTAALKSLEEAVAQSKDDIETWSSNAKIPALLHVNCEARHEASMHYKLSLGVGDHPPRIYVDFARDTLFFGSSELKPECSSLWSSTKDFEKVRHLALVPEGAWRILRWKKAELNRLQKMIFVHDTEKLELGPTPQLVEDEAQDEDHEQQEELPGRTSEAQESETEATTLTEDDATTKRILEAREELETLMLVLPTQWESQPAVATAVFKIGSGDREM
jgi:hypothetical protein